MFDMLRKIKGKLTDEIIFVSGEEARVVIKALERSAQAMPESNETLGSRDVREKRERRVARALRQRIGSPLD